MIAGSIGTVFLIILVLYCLCKKNKQIHRLYTSIRQKVFWNIIIRQTLEHYLMLSISYTIKLYALSFGIFKETFISLYSVAVILFLITTPLLARKFLYRHYDAGTLKSEEFSMKYGEWVKLVNLNWKPALLFNVVFMARRALMAFIIVVLVEWNWLQR